MRAGPRAGPLLEPGARCVIGHRGSAGSAPENTIPSFDLAMAEGAVGLEMDIRITADGVAVVLHDPTLDRTTNGTGPLRSYRWLELERFDAGGWFSPDGRTRPFRDRGVRVPRLREVLERYPDTPLLIELKEIEAQEPVRDELLRAGAADRVVVASFLHRALDLFRRPPFLVGASRRDIVALKLDSLVRRVPRDRRVVAYAVPYSYKNRIRVPTPRLLAAANQLQRPVHVWTVDDPGLARDLWRMGVAGVISNFPGRLRTVDRPATSSPSSDPPIL